MSGVLKIEIVESEVTLKKLLTQQKSVKTKERVQVLYWLKTLPRKQCRTSSSNGTVGILLPSLGG